MVADIPIFFLNSSLYIRLQFTLGISHFCRRVKIFLNFDSKLLFLNLIVTATEFQEQSFHQVNLWRKFVFELALKMSNVAFIKFYLELKILSTKSRLLVLKKFAFSGLLWNIQKIICFEHTYLTNLNTHWTTH